MPSHELQSFSGKERLDVSKLEADVMKGVAIWATVVIGGAIFWVYVIRVLWGFRPHSTPW